MASDPPAEANVERAEPPRSRRNSPPFVGDVVLADGVEGRSFPGAVGKPRPPAHFDHLLWALVGRRISREAGAPHGGIGWHTPQGPRSSPHRAAAVGSMNRTRWAGVWALVVHRL